MRYLQGLVLFTLAIALFNVGDVAQAKSLNQVIRFEWNQVEGYNAYTMVSNMNSTNTPCGNNCVSISLNATAPFVTGGIKVVVTQARSNADVPVSNCKAVLEIPFEIKSSYLVTRIKSYTFFMSSSIHQSCPKTGFTLNIKGDPTKRSGYTITLSISPVIKS